MPVKKKTTALARRASSIANELNSALKLGGLGMRMGSDPYFRITRVPTGSLTIDRLTGGGLAHGRHYEFYGDEHTCKSYISYLTMALAQRRGKIAACIDPEHSFDSEWFAQLGGIPEELLLHQPDNAEDAVAAMMMMARIIEENESLLEVVMIDSVASLVPGEDMAKDPREEDRMGSQARMMSRALRRITTVNRKTIFIWTNQERMNIGIRFGNPKTTSGGRALRYYASGRIEFRRGTKVLAKRHRARGGKLVEADVQVGRWIQCRVEKEKTTRPYREGSFIFDNERSEISLPSELIQLGLEDGLIDKTARGYSYVDLDDEEWSGTEKQFTRYLRENKVLRHELVSAIEDKSLRGDEPEEEDG